MPRAYGRTAVLYRAARTSASLDVKIKHLKSLLTRAADALEKSPSEADSQLAEELRKAAATVQINIVARYNLGIMSEEDIFSF